MTDEMKTSGRIVPGSGLDKLKGIAETLEVESDENGKTVIFDYSLVEN